jgi:hypothetical protein
MEKHYCPKCGKFIASPDVHKLEESSSGLVYEWLGNYQDFAEIGLEEVCISVKEFMECKHCDKYFVQVDELAFEFNNSKNEWEQIFSSEKVLLN